MHNLIYSDPVANAYLNAADKFQDVIKLEKSIVELHQMFVDMVRVSSIYAFAIAVVDNAFCLQAVLVEQQGEMLDKIEYSVNAAEVRIVFHAFLNVTCQRLRLGIRGKR